MVKYEFIKTIISIIQINIAYKSCEYIRNE